MSAVLAELVELAKRSRDRGFLSRAQTLRLIEICTESGVSDADILRGLGPATETFEVSADAFPMLQATVTVRWASPEAAQDQDVRLALRRWMQRLERIAFAPSPKLREHGSAEYQAILEFAIEYLPHNPAEFIAICNNVFLHSFGVEDAAEWLEEARRLVRCRGELIYEEWQLSNAQAAALDQFTNAIHREETAT